MRPLMFTLGLSSALVLSACAGGVSGSFRGNGGAAGPPVAASAVKVVASKADMTGAYTELGIAKGSAPTAPTSRSRTSISRAASARTSSSRGSTRRRSTG